VLHNCGAGNGTKLFFNVKLPDDGFHGGLDAASIQWLINEAGIFALSFSARKEKMGMSVHFPEISQHAQGLFRQRRQPVLVALGIADMDLHIFGIDIANGESDAFAKAQPHAVSGKEKDPVAQPVGRGKQTVQLLDGQDIRDPGSLWRFDQGDVLPGFVQYPGVKEIRQSK